MSGSTQSHSGALGDIKGFIQLIPGTNKCETLNNITGVKKVHLKCDCIDGKIVTEVGEPILCSFAPDKPRDMKIMERPESNF